MNEKDFDRLLNEALNIPIPYGLAERLEKQIEQQAAAEKNRTPHTIYYRLISLAAIVLLAIGIFLQINKQPHTPTDTFTDPVEATLAAEQALGFMSRQLNRGLDRITYAQQEFEKANKTLEKYFNK
ncbi:MAG: DUF3379 domain-containing protein [Tannerellaceae bacterium]|jgi:uncharacterized protein HemX|nr:DUF3379 domain-containing protein [Tannerellaceae bacterium]